MTDHDPTPRDTDDEIASARLDGEAEPTTDHATDRALANRLDELAEVKDRVAEPITPPVATVRDAMIARAIDEGMVGLTLETAPSTAPTDIDTARRRPGRLRAVAPIAAAAAVLLVAVIVTPALLDGPDDDLTAASFDQAEDGGAEEATEGASGDADGTGEAGLADTAEAESQRMAPESDADESAVIANTESADQAAPTSPQPGAAQRSASGSDDANAFSSTDDAVMLDRLSQPDVAAYAEALDGDDRCVDVVSHRVDRVVDGRYDTADAWFFVLFDGDRAVQVTVVDRDCTILARIPNG